MDKKQELKEENIFFLDSVDGYLEKLKDFLENGGNKNITDIHGNTLLHMAVKYNQVRIVWLLIRKGIHLDTQNNIGDTALHLACKKGCLEVAEELYRKGAKIRIKNNEGRLPLSFLNPKQQTIFQDFRERLYMTGKYQVKTRPETPHNFHSGYSSGKCTRFS